jgi:hypothetical protein
VTTLCPGVDPQSPGADPPGRRWRAPDGIAIDARGLAPPFGVVAIGGWRLAFLLAFLLAIRQRIMAFPASMRAA